MRVLSFEYCNFNSVLSVVNFSQNQGNRGKK